MQNNSFNELDSKIIWISHLDYDANNSAIELGKEFLEHKNYEFIKLNISLLKLFKLFNILKKRNEVFYYQISTPILNIFVLLLIFFTKRKVAVHYLDDISMGYPWWAKVIQLDKVIYCLLIKSNYSIFISKVMLRYFKKKLSLNNHLSVYYRILPDRSKNNLENIEVCFQSCFIYAGAINKKTNLEALENVIKVLNEYNYSLHIFTRGNMANNLVLIKSENVEIHPEALPSDIVEISKRYEGILLPFNDNTQKFYRMSVPSKLPNVIMSKRPIIYYGPKSFWLYHWIRKHPKYFFSLNDYFKQKKHKLVYISDDAKDEIYASFKSEQMYLKK